MRYLFGISARAIFRVLKIIIIAELFIVMTNIARLVKTVLMRKNAPSPGGGDFNFICTGVCGHRIGKLTHPQTKPGQKTDPFSDYLQ